MVESIDEFFGRNVSYAKDKYEAYNRLREDSKSPFKGRSMVDIFVSAAVAGFVNKKRSKLKKKTPNISAVAMTPEQKAVLLTIAISTEGAVDILFKKAKVVDIIEEYANSGIDVLESRVSESMYVEPIEKMALDMKEAAKHWQAKYGL